jgi:hypothetical protein
MPEGKNQGLVTICDYKLKRFLYTVPEYLSEKAHYRYMDQHGRGREQKATGDYG